MEGNMVCSSFPPPPRFGHFILWSFFPSHIFPGLFLPHDCSEYMMRWDPVHTLYFFFFLRYSQIRGFHFLHQAADVIFLSDMISSCRSYQWA